MEYKVNIIITNDDGEVLDAIIVIIACSSRDDLDGLIEDTIQDEGYDILDVDYDYQVIDVTG